MTDLGRVTDWFDRTLRVAAFDDVSNNGLQIDRRARSVKTVAFAVDASVRTIRAAAAVGADLLVVHHGISWGGGIRRLTAGAYEVVKAAMDADLALYACHLPLDAHPTLGNNAQLARLLKLQKVRPAFAYHGVVIGAIGVSSGTRRIVLGETALNLTKGQVLGVCSGGAGEFAEDAKRLGCDIYLTGEASWADVIAAENIGQKMVCAGHYETEVFGVRAVAGALRTALRLTAIDLTGDLR